MERIGQDPHETPDLLVHTICEGCHKCMAKHMVSDLSGRRCLQCGRKDVAYQRGIGMALMCVECFAAQPAPVGDEFLTCWHCTRPFDVMVHGWIVLEGCKCVTCGRNTVRYRSARTVKGKPKVCVDCPIYPNPQVVGPPQEPVPVSSETCWHCTRPFTVGADGSLKKYKYEVRVEVDRCSFCGCEDGPFQRSKGIKICRDCHVNVPDTCWHCTRPFTTTALVGFKKGYPKRYNYEGPDDRLLHKICHACHIHVQEYGGLAGCRCSVCGRTDAPHRPKTSPNVCVKCPDPRKPTTCELCSCQFNVRVKGKVALSCSVEVNGALRTVCVACAEGLARVLPYFSKAQTGP